ncbi:MAG TPA: AmmeMemoRadiSam system protein A [Desulfatiglandales bacterium]|nr:AmmeMemoRadiSam system protein A [Desulfatiglandales bacterium]
MADNNVKKPKKIVKKIFLSAVAILFFWLVYFPKPYFTNSIQEAREEFKEPVNCKTGVNKMETTNWLSEDEGKDLLKVARETIKSKLFTSEEPRIDWENMPDIYKHELGTFVTITIKDNLRGCIGHIIPRETLIEGIMENAVNAAFRDPRFSPLTKEEFEKIEIEVSVLTRPKELSYADAEDLLKKLRQEVDGVIIKKGFHEATFLPQVWEQLPDKEEFLMHLCLKAGLFPKAWQTEKLQVSTYQVQAFQEEESK